MQQHGIQEAVGQWCVAASRLTALTLKGHQWDKWIFCRLSGACGAFPISLNLALVQNCPTLKTYSASYSSRSGQA